MAVIGTPGWPLRAGQGFTLVELMLAAALGLMLFGVALSMLMGDSARSAAMAEAIQVRRLQRRTLRLIQADLANASGWIVDPDSTTPGGCGLSQRRPLLAITPRDGSPVLVYSVGDAPSAIWRSPVLMRCGPAYALDGVINLEGAYQNRVLLDALPDRSVPGFSAQNHPTLPLLQLQLQQDVRDASGQHRRFQSRLDA